MDFPVLDPQMRLADALELLNLTPSATIIAPETGRILGVLSRPAALPPPDPPRLGGMATPLGVYLTDGVTSGGAGFWGLFLTGITLSVVILAAQALAQGGLQAIAHLTGRSLWGWADSPSQGPVLRAWLTQLLGWLPIPLIFVLLRLIPLSGTHGAEHQVVHCVERRTPLVPECIRAMPRVHPRCGTNLFVGFILFQLTFAGVFSALQAAGWQAIDAATLAVILAALPAWLFWRRLGGFIQRWFATRPATDRQIAGAIRAANQVLARHEALAHRPIRFRPLRRLWSMGLVQVMLGYAALMGPLALLAMHWPALGRALGL